MKAGESFPVFETDIGRIGFATCYDILFAEHCRIIALNGADIIIHATLGWGIGHNIGMGEALVRVRAAENSVYMIAAKSAEDGCKSCIADNNGNILAESAEIDENIIYSEFEPDYDKINKAGFNSLFSGIDSERARFLLERNPQLYSAVTNPTPFAMEQYNGIDFSSSPEQIKDIFNKWREYLDSVEANRPVDFHYHW